MSQGQTGWLLILLMAILMIIIGFQGSLGVFIAILFCPRYVTVVE